MASPKTLTSTVPFQTPNGTPIANGYVIFDLSQPATITGTGGQIAPTRVTVNLDANGNVAANQSIYANDQLSPSGTLYLIRIESNTNLLLSPTP